MGGGSGELDAGAKGEGRDGVDGLGRGDEDVVLTFGS